MLTICGRSHKKEPSGKSKYEKNKILKELRNKVNNPKDSLEERIRLLEEPIELLEGNRKK